MAGPRVWRGVVILLRLSWSTPDALSGRSWAAAGPAWGGREGLERAPSGPESAPRRHRWRAHEHGTAAPCPWASPGALPRLIRVGLGPLSGPPRAPSKASRGSREGPRG
eukprot:9482454-Pyramimonas_sp.AAC.1